jgi:hypothetical protein
MLDSGDQINFPSVNSMRVQNYTPGTDVTIDDFVATADTLVIDQSIVSSFSLDQVERKQALANYSADLAFQQSFELSNRVDQTCINTGVTAATAANTIAGGTLASSTIMSTLNSARAQLSRNNAVDGELFCVMDPERVALLSDSFIANGFNLGDVTLQNGFRGNAAGFSILESNNLPYSVTLTMDTIPTATDTTILMGVTWTWVAAGAAAAAGDIAVGANVAASKVNFVLAMTGTAAGSAATYIDVSTANRRIYQNAQLAAATFVGDDCVITAFGIINASETFTPATNIFGTETSSLLCGRVGAVSLAMQMMPHLEVREEPKQLSQNYLTHTLYGTTVFDQDIPRLVEITMNA